MPRRILLLITDLEIGGTPTVVRELAIRLNDPPEVVVEVACLKGWGPVADQLRDAGITVTAFGAGRARQLPWVVSALRTLVRSRGIDTLFSFLVHANLVGAIASRGMAGLRSLQSIQTVQPKPRWHWAAQRFAQRQAAVVVVPSSAVAAVARERCGVPAERLTIVPNAVDVGEFPRVSVSGQLNRIGYIGRLDPAKDPGNFVDCVSRALLDSPHVEGHLFGDGPARPELERAIAASPRPDCFHLHGWVGRAQDALSQVDVLYLPSTIEGFGLVLIEAMASGVPVIARSAGGVLDVVTHRVDGLLVSADRFSVTQFAHALVRLRTNPTFRELLITNALATVARRFSWEAVLAEYRRLLAIKPPDQS